MWGLLKGPDPSGAVYWAPNLLIGVPRRGYRDGSRSSVAVCGLLSFLRGVSLSERGWISFSGSQGSLFAFGEDSRVLGIHSPSLCGPKSPLRELGGI